MEGPPSRRANATLTPCPNGNHLWCIGGEYFSEDGKAVRIVFTPSCDTCSHPTTQYFYNDVFRYSPDKVRLRTVQVYILSCPRRTNGENSFLKPARVPGLHTASSRHPSEVANSTSLVRSSQYRSLPSLICCRWGIFVLVSKQLPSLSRFLDFRYPDACLGENRDQGATERTLGSPDGHVETFDCLVWRIL